MDSPDPRNLGWGVVLHNEPRPALRRNLVAWLRHGRGRGRAIGSWRSARHRSTPPTCAGMHLRSSARLLISTHRALHLTGVDFGPWLHSEAGKTILGRWASSCRGSARTRTAGTTWRGCAGLTGS